MLIRSPLLHASISSASEPISELSGLGRARIGHITVLMGETSRFEEELISYLVDGPVTEIWLARLRKIRLRLPGCKLVRLAMSSIAMP